MLLAPNCADKTIKDKEEDEGQQAGDIDFSDISAEACACDNDCLLAKFDCVRTCSGPDDPCLDDCQNAYAACASQCQGCISLYTLCYKLCGDNPDCTVQCDQGLPECQQACGWNPNCMDQCNQADSDCYDECGGAWDCYTGCIGQTKNCYASCF